MLCRFTGHEPEPRPDVPSGHMPNSFSVPFDSFMQKQSSESGLNYTFFASPSTIAKTLTARLGESLSSQILDNSHSVVVTCGSGMTACVLWLGLTLLGVVDVRLYDEVCHQLLWDALTHRKLCSLGQVMLFRNPAQLFRQVDE